ncbi:MAG TPA: ABC transporter permease [Solirubrobacteraceae bacterium]|nr:ABC transporter permease [Solirubrobacteraceae bacterium]
MRSRTRIAHAGRGLLIPLITVVLAFIAGGLVVLFTGHNPFSTYGAIFDGTGLNWLFPWVSGTARTTAAFNLQQTLVAATPLILTGLSVAFAFRVGLFNIGAQGQYTVGGVMAVWIGSIFPNMTPVLHIVLAITAAALMGGAWAAIAGWLRAVVGTHEVLSTIMLNWIAIWVASYLFQAGGPLQSTTQAGNPVSNTIVAGAHLPVIWGNPLLQGLSVGIFVSLAAAVAFWAIMNRSTLGYELRAVGHSPDAARGAGISVARSYAVTMAICGVFAGLAAATDVLGWEFQISTGDLTISQVGFLGIAVALLGRNTAIGTVAAALLFGALETGTSVRALNSNVFNPELASQLTLIIEGLVVLLVSTDLIAVRVLGLPAKLGLGRPRTEGGRREFGMPDEAATAAAVTEGLEGKLEQGV